MSKKSIQFSVRKRTTKRDPKKGGRNPRYRSLMRAVSKLKRNQEIRIKRSEVATRSALANTMSMAALRHTIPHRVSVLDRGKVFVIVLADKVDEPKFVKHFRNGASRVHGARGSGWGNR